MSTDRAGARFDPGLALPFFERLAPPPPAPLLVSRIDQHTGPGDVVADLAGRGGWVARAALDRQRRAISIETSPLTRMLAEVVLRPPDVRHLDAAFQGIPGLPADVVPIRFDERVAQRAIGGTALRMER